MTTPTFDRATGPTPAPPAQRVETLGVHIEHSVEVKPLAAAMATHDITLSHHDIAHEAPIPMYWALVTDGHAVKVAQRLCRNSGAVRALDPAAVRAIGVSFGGDLPFTLDELHAVGILVTNTIVVCGAERRLLAQVPPTQLTLCPDALPEFVRGAAEREAGAALRCGHFNLLQHEFEPAQVRSARSRLWNLITAAACVAMLIAAAGQWRRAGVWSDDAAARTTTAQTIADTMYPGEHLAAHDAVRRAQRETSDAEALHVLMRAQRTLDGADDCADTLAALLARWPRPKVRVGTVPDAGAESSDNGGESFQTEVLSLTDNSIAATVVTSTDARSFLDQLRAPDGWTLQQPRLSQSPSGVRLAVQMARAKPENPANPEGGSP
jgi:hypothetical protein